jgi:hypothetical protein
MFLGPEGGDGVGDFVLEDFDEFFAFRLTIGSALYKYMRICLWIILRIKFFRRGFRLRQAYGGQVTQIYTAKSATKRHKNTKVSAGLVYSARTVLKTSFCGGIVPSSTRSTALPLYLSWPK